MTTEGLPVGLWSGYDVGKAIAMEGSLPLNDLSETSLSKTLYSR
jgi:hypothetical protein